MFLVVAGVTNAVLNMILVIVFHLGVAGVAIATIISPADFLYSGSSLSVYDGQQLSAPVFQIVHEEILSGTDFPGGNTGRSAEYGY